MSGSTIGSIVGAGVGALIGGPAGAKWGFMIGGAIGGYVDPVKVKGPRLGEGQSVTSQEGIPIPFGFGTFPCGGNLIWCGDLVEHEQREGGKGGGGTQTTSYTYSRSYAVGICEGEITAIAKVWRNGKLVYDITPTSTILGQNSKFLDSHTFYVGSETQTVDPIIEAAVGVGNSGPMRGLAYMVCEDEDLTDTGGAVAQYRFVVQMCGTITSNTPDQFIVTASANEVRTTVDGSTWNDQTGGLSGVTLRWMAAEGDVVVSVTSGGQFYRSLDRGVNWVAATTGPFTGTDSYNIDGISVFNGLWVAFTQKQDVNRTCTTIISTDNGDTWVEHSQTFEDARAITVNNVGVFIIVTGVNGNGIYSSTSGTSWTQRSTSIRKYCVHWNGEYFLAAGDTGGGATSFQSSPTGTTWTSMGSPALSGTPLKLCGALGYFLCATNTGFDIYKSTDNGTSWTQKYGTAASPTCAASGNGLDVIGIAANVYFSADAGESWTSNPISDVTTIDLQYMGPNGGWYEVPDATNVYADEDGVVITSFTNGTTVTVCGAYLDDIVSALCDRAGVDPTEYDVTDLSAIFVKGYPCATESSAQGFIEPLTNAFFFDRGEWDKKIRFILRGAASAASLDTDDLVAMNGPAIVQTRVQEVELLRKVNVMTIDPDAEYNATKQSWERRIGTIEAKGESTVEIPIVTDADTAAQIAEKRGKVAWAETDKFSMGYTLAQSELTVTDVITQTDKAGKAHRVRLTAMTESAGVITIEEAMKDRASTYGSTATGAVNDNLPVGSDVQLIGPTRLQLAALPVLRSQDNSPGIYVGMCGILDGWGGAQLLMSVDGGVSYSAALSVTEPTMMGELTADEDSNGEPIAVRFFGGTPVNVTMAQVAVGANWSAITTATVSEIIAYETQTQTGSVTYDLTDITRALDDTVYAFHSAGDLIMDLNTANFLPIPQGLAGTTLYFKAVGFGVSADAVTAVAFAWAGVEYVEDGGLAA